MGKGDIIIDGDKILVRRSPEAMGIHAPTLSVMFSQAGIFTVKMDDNSAQNPAYQRALFLPESDMDPGMGGLQTAIQKLCPRLFLVPA
jgi:hypothetical protein